MLKFPQRRFHNHSFFFLSYSLYSEPMVWMLCFSLRFSIITFYIIYSWFCFCLRPISMISRYTYYWPSLSYRFGHVFTN